MLHTDQMVDTAERLLSESGHVRDGQILGMVAGTRTKSGSTNFLRLHTVGDSDRLSRKHSSPAKQKKKKTKISRQSDATASATQAPQK
jgi:pyruvate kinase